MYLYSQPPPALYSQLPGNHRSSHNFHHRTPGGQVHGSRKTELKFTLSPSDVQQDEQADPGQAEQHLWSRSPPRSFSVGPCSGAHDEESKLRSEPKSESESEDGRWWWWWWGEIALTHARWIRAAAVKETILTPHLLRRQRKQTALRGNRNPTLCCGANIRTVTVLIIERGARRPAPGKMMHLKISLSLWKPRSGLCASMS